MQVSGNMQPLASTPPGHVLSVAKLQTAGQVVAGQLAVTGIQVSGIGQPSGITPPGHWMWSRGQVTGQVTGQSAVMGIHVLGIGHPLVSIPPPQCMWSGGQVTGHATGHALPSIPIGPMDVDVSFQKFDFLEKIWNLLGTQIMWNLELKLYNQAWLLGWAKQDLWGLGAES